MSNRINAILEFCEENNIEIISYGLAPNPNGFCFEYDDRVTDCVEKLDELLDSLSSIEVSELRKILFG